MLINAPRWLFLATLVYAPWAYGCTRPWTIDILNGLLGASMFLWVAGCAARRAWPAVPRVPVMVAALLVAQAWWMVANAKSEYDPVALHYVPLSPWLSWAPGSLHKALSMTAAMRMTALLWAGCFCCDLARRVVWRKRLLLTMALTGVSIVVFGLTQRLVGAQSIFWAQEDTGRTFFAAYRYHANAGSFINLIWPIIAGLFLVSLRKEEDDPRKRFFWGAALIVCLAGVVVNASRAANVLALGLLGVWVARFLWGRKRGAHHRTPIKPATMIVISLSLIMLLAAVAAFGGLDTSLRRWSKVSEEWSARNPRLLVAQVCMRMLPDAGAFGFGPGTFQTVFPYYTSELGDEISGVWECAHDDYLQMLLEWGLVGGGLWAIYLLGGVAVSLRTAARNGLRLAAADRLVLFSVWTALLGVFLHAGMDFPLQVASIQLYVVVLGALLWSCRSWVSKGQSHTRMQTKVRSARELCDAAVN